MNLVKYMFCIGVLFGIIYFLLDDLSDHALICIHIKRHCTLQNAQITTKSNDVYDI